MRELRRVLDMLAGREAWISLLDSQCRFVLSSQVEDGEDNIRVLESKGGDTLVTHEWQEVSNFIREKGYENKIDQDEANLYFLVLTKVVGYYLYFNPEMSIPTREKAMSVSYLAKDEPLLKEVLELVW